ncbi:S1 family peptidase [Streptomyces sp. NPDC001093]|uniref:S1 family peptidase n=1 Tax=Streptomyces sp. NPDC001093 TaxID=3154376 RepID=UPI0033235FA7
MATSFAEASPSAIPGEGAKVAANQTAGGHPPGTSLQDVQLMNNQRVLDKIVDQITGGKGEADRAQIPGFTDVEVIPAQMHIRLYWKGEVPAYVKNILSSLPSGVTAEVLPAKYSKAELHAAREKMISNRKLKNIASSLTSAPSRITSVALAVDGSGLDIGYDEDRGVGKRDDHDPLTPTARQDKTREVKAAADRETGVETHVMYKPLVTDASTRQVDSSPWWGGAGLQTPGGTICSTGFGVTTTDGRKLITTAYHCGDGSFHTWGYGGNGPHNYVGVTSSLDWSDQSDVSGLTTQSGLTGAHLYDGAWDDTTGYAKPVSGWAHNNKGDQVCTSGANGGVHCGITINQTDTTVVGSNGILRPDVDLAYASPNSIAAVNGDSGGPVFSGANNWTTDVARGTITALDTTTNCNGQSTADAWQRTPWCFNGVYYVPIAVILADKGWTLNTSTS